METFPCKIFYYFHGNMMETLEKSGATSEKYRSYIAFKKLHCISTATPNFHFFNSSLKKWTTPTTKNHTPPHITMETYL